MEAEIRVMQSWAKEYGQPQEAEKRLRIDSFFKPAKGMLLCQHLEFSLVRPISNF